MMEERNNSLDTDSKMADYQKCLIRYQRAVMRFAPAELMALDKEIERAQADSPTWEEPRIKEYRTSSSQLTHSILSLRENPEAREQYDSRIQELERELGEITMRSDFSCCALTFEQLCKSAQYNPFNKESADPKPISWNDIRNAAYPSSQANIINEISEPEHQLGPEINVLTRSVQIHISPAKSRQKAYRCLTPGKSIPSRKEDGSNRDSLRGPGTHTAQADLTPICDTSMYDTMIVFCDEDLPTYTVRYNEALFVTLQLDQIALPRVLIDNGSGINILSLSVLTALQIDVNRVKHSRQSVRAYDCSSRRVLGIITLKLFFRTESVFVDFNILDITCNYMALLGRSWLHQIKGISSTRHQCVKFINSKGNLEVIRGEDPVRS